MVKFRQFPFHFLLCTLLPSLLLPSFEISHKPLVRQIPEYCEGQTGESGLTSPQRKRQPEGRDRVETPCKREDYSFSNYLSYSVYSPLYLAGPIMTFNDYISQVRVLCIDFITVLTILATAPTPNNQFGPYCTLWYSSVDIYSLHGSHSAFHVCGSYF